MRPHTETSKQAMSGFTLIEAMIVMALLAIFLTTLTTLFTKAIDIQGRSEGYAAVATDGRFIMARLNYDIARASAITTPSTLGASGSSLVMTVGGVTYTYALNGANLQLTDGSGSANLNSSGATVSNLSFQKLGNNGGKESIRYSLTLTSTARHVSGNDTATYTDTVERR